MSRTVPYHTTVQLDGSASYDPDGGLVLQYQWQLTPPSGSAAALSSMTASSPTFYADLPGAYVVSLVVNDGQKNSTAALITITATNAAPIANAGQNRNINTGDAIVLDGSASSDPNGDALTYSWTVTARPAGSSAAVSGASSASAGFTPDIDGSYEITLVVNDGYLSSAPAKITIASFHRIARWSYRVIDAEYSSGLDRIITISTSPNTLHIYNPATDSTSDVALPAIPIAVSVSPDGLKAAVAHDAYVTIVNLQTATLTVTYPATVSPQDVVLAGNGYAYLFATGNSFSNIHCIRLSDGRETTNTGGLVYDKTKAKLQPGGTTMYGADNGVSPDDIFRFNLGTGTAALAYDSPYHGDYGMCGDLWIAQDGLLIFTKCGNVFHATSSQTTDMTYAGALSGVTYLQHLVHASTPNKVLAIPGVVPYSGMGNEDEVLRIYSYAFLAFDQQIALPSFVLSNMAFAGHGRFAFINSAGTQYYVVLQADSTASLGTADYGLATYAF